MESNNLNTPRLTVIRDNDPVYAELQSNFVKINAQAVSCDCIKHIQEEIDILKNKLSNVMKPETRSEIIKMIFNFEKILLKINKDLGIL